MIVLPTDPADTYSLGHSCTNYIYLFHYMSPIQYEWFKLLMSVFHKKPAEGEAKRYTIGDAGSCTPLMHPGHLYLLSTTSIRGTESKVLWSTEPADGSTLIKFAELQESIPEKQFGEFLLILAKVTIRRAEKEKRKRPNYWRSEHAA